MRSLGIRLDARHGGNGRRSVLERISTLRLRSLAIRIAERQRGPGNHVGYGLINENGKPAWEEPPQEEGHEFRRYVYEILRYPKQS